MRSWKTAVIVVGMACGVGASAVVGQSNPNPTRDDKAVTNGAPGKTTNTGVLRSAQDDGKNDTAAIATIAATPAIWKVKGAHGTVYLFGTIHVMKPNVEWETAKVKSAFAASDTVYVEVANLDDKTAGLSLAAQFGLDMAHPLSTKIGKDDVDLLDKTAKGMGLPGESTFEPMQPWLVTMTVSVMPMLKAGYDPASGVDVVLLKQARDAGKKIVGLETMEQQLHFVADEPQAEQVEMLHKELTEMDKNTAEMADMVSAWEKGEVGKIGALENGEMKTKYAAEYKTLVVDRNTKWATTLDGLLKDPATGTVFVAVGAAHLAGEDSVIEMLKKDGWKAERE